MVCWVGSLGGVALFIVATHVHCHLYCVVLACVWGGRPASHGTLIITRQP